MEQLIAELTSHLSPKDGNVAAGTCTKCHKVTYIVRDTCGECQRENW